MYIYKDVITLEKGKRGGIPCIRGMRITVVDIFRYLNSGMSIDDVLTDFPELTAYDISVVLEARTTMIEYFEKRLREELAEVLRVKKYSDEDYTRMLNDDNFPVEQP